MINKYDWTPGENKPNSKPIKANRRALAGYSSAFGSYFPCAAGRASLEYAKICVNSLNVPEL